MLQKKLQLKDYIQLMDKQLRPLYFTTIYGTFHITQN